LSKNIDRPPHKDRAIIEELVAETEKSIYLFHLNWEGQLTVVDHIGFSASPKILNGDACPPLILRTGRSNQGGV